MDVLLVEDEPLVREVVAEMLEDAGLTVSGAESADAALAAVGMAPAADDVAPPPPPPTVLVTDVNLGPDSSMDGIELAETLRRCWPWLGVVVITGRESNLGRCGALAPNERHLLKPFAPDDLVHAVRALGAPCGMDAPRG
jgi:CheY-like chemotaxis protein